MESKPLPLELTETLHTDVAEFIALPARTSGAHTAGIDFIGALADHSCYSGAIGIVGLIVMAGALG